MLPENIKWDAVFQSIVDTWLPMIGVGIIIIVLLWLFTSLKRNEKNKLYIGKRLF